MTFIPTFIPPLGDRHSLRFLLHLPPFLWFWESIVMDTFQLPARRSLVAASPLFEEESDVALLALVADPQGPFLLHRAWMNSSFPAHDDPVDSLQIELRQGADQRLARKKSHSGGDLAQAVDAVRHQLFRVSIAMGCTPKRGASSSAVLLRISVFATPACLPYGASMAGSVRSKHSHRTSAGTSSLPANSLASRSNS
jgi:hypothetical protein